MPKFPKNTGFKLPGIGSREIDTPGNFRKSQKVEDVGYCDNTDPNMLPPGSSPLLATDEPKDWLVPDYYHTTYTSSVGDPKGKPKGKDKDKDKVTSQLEPPPYKDNLPNVPELEVPNLVSKSKGGKESITIGQPGTESYSGESAQSKLGRSMTADEKAWMNKEIERLGGVQQYRDYYKIGTKTTTPGSEFTISGYELEDSRKKKK